VFLIIIFSQLTSVAVSNYGVKKMLPRLVIAALLVNVSFYICQIAVDLSNILGYGLKEFFDGIGATVINDSGGIATDVNGNGGFSGWSPLVVTVIAVAGGAIVWSQVGTLIAVLIGALIGILTIFFILILRQMLIILLIVVSPLAFVAFLLPNTEDLFTKWRKTFVALLMVFPIIGVVFGASSLASGILRVTYAQTDDTISQIIAAGVLFVPLIAVPFILKSSLDSLGKLGGMINGLGSRIGKSAGNGAVGAYRNSNFGKFRAQKKAENQARTATGTYRGWNPLRRAASAVNRRANNSDAFNKATGGFGAYRDLGAQAQGRKDMDEVMGMFNGDDDLAALWAETGGDLAAIEAWGARPENAGKLTQGRREQISRMRAAGHHRNPMSHLAVAKYLSEAGKGTGTQVQAALSRAAAGGASATVVDSAREQAKAAYRASGRGDALAEIMGVTPEEGWAQVAGNATHREGVTTAQQKADYADYLRFGAHDANGNVIREGRTATLEALRGFDKLETRAQNEVHDLLLQAATHHSGGTVFTDIQAAKAFFGIQ
jgi:hypothetical protein